MAIRKITKKVITPVKPVGVKKEQEVKVEKSVEEVVVESPKGEESSTRQTRAKRECQFCQSKTSPSYTELSSLRRYLTDRAKIVGKERSGVCSRHQRQVSKNIKWARHLALLPFVPKV